MLDNYFSGMGGSGEKKMRLNFVAGRVEIIPEPGKDLFSSRQQDFLCDSIYFKSKKLIDVRIRKLHNQYSLCNEELGIWVHTESFEEGLEEFVKTVIHFYKHYKNKTLKELVGEAIRLKRVYEEAFEEEKNED